MSEIDSQQIELIGRNRLVNELIAAGIEVSLPLRDRGIDVIAYLDRDDQLGRFVAFPIQMKASSKPRFGVEKKYLRTKNIILAFVWNVGQPGEEETYAMTYPEGVKIVEAMGWSGSSSWRDKGGYSSQAGRKLTKLLDAYRMTPDLWRKLIVRATGEQS